MGGGRNDGKFATKDIGFSGKLRWNAGRRDAFGASVANIGDLNGDGVTDLAVGANNDDDLGPQSGAVWILFINANGTVASEQKISNIQGGFGGALNSDKSAKSDKSEKSGKSGKSDKSGKSAKSGKSDKFGKSGKSGE